MWSKNLAHLTKLEAKFRDGTITQSELEELEDLRDAEGQGSLFSEGTEALGRKAQSAGLDKQAEIKEGQEKSLIGCNYSGPVI